MKPKTLQLKLRNVALDYMLNVADLLGRDLHDCHWVGTDANECGIYTICDFGDTTFLTLDQMQVIIDRLPDWLKRYGTREAVAQEIEDWMEWSIQEENHLDGHSRINLEHWLMGCPREPKTDTTIDDTIQDYRDIIHALSHVGDTISHTLTIAQAIEAMQARLRDLEVRKRIEDEAAYEKIKDTEAYKHFRKMMEDEA